MNQITVEDFDNAVRSPISTNTCIVAQTNIRIDGGTSIMQRYDIISTNAAARSVMNVFDKYFTRPGDENKPELQALRASLPINL